MHNKGPGQRVRVGGATGLVDWVKKAKDYKGEWETIVWVSLDAKPSAHPEPYKEREVMAVSEAESATGMRIREAAMIREHLRRSVDKCRKEEE